MIDHREIAERGGQARFVPEPPSQVACLLEAPRGLAPFLALRMVRPETAEALGREPLGVGLVAQDLQTDFELGAGFVDIRSMVGELAAQHVQVAAVARIDGKPRGDSGLGEADCRHQSGY